MDVLCFKRWFQNEQNVKEKGKKKDMYWLEQQRQVYVKTRWDLEGPALVCTKARWSRGKCPAARSVLGLQWPTGIVHAEPTCPGDTNIHRARR